MKALFKLFLVAFLLGGWALAASAVQVVRTQGTCPLSCIKFMPKDHLTYRGTWVDTTKWTAADVAAHPRIAEKLHLTVASASGECDACNDAAKTAMAK